MIAAVLTRHSLLHFNWLQKVFSIVVLKTRLHIYYKKKTAFEWAQQSNWSIYVFWRFLSNFWFAIRMLYYMWVDPRLRLSSYLKCVQSSATVLCIWPVPTTVPSGLSLRPVTPTLSKSIANNMHNGPLQNFLLQNVEQALHIWFQSEIVSVVAVIVSCRNAKCLQK